MHASEYLQHVQIARSYDFDTDHNRLRSQEFHGQHFSNPGPTSARTTFFRTRRPESILDSFEPKVIPGSPILQSPDSEHGLKMVTGTGPAYRKSPHHRLPMKASSTVFMRKAAAASIEVARFYPSISRFSPLSVHTSPVPNAQRNRKSI